MTDEAMRGIGRGRMGKHMAGGGFGCGPPPHSTAQPHLMLDAEPTKDSLIQHVRPVGGPHHDDACTPPALHAVPQLHELRLDLKQQE